MQSSVSTMAILSIWLARSLRFRHEGGIKSNTFRLLHFPAAPRPRGFGKIQGPSMLKAAYGFRLGLVNPVRHHASFISTEIFHGGRHRYTEGFYLLFIVCLDHAGVRAVFSAASGEAAVIKGCPASPTASFPISRPPLAYCLSIVIVLR